jgi:protein-disulfide isomerase
MRASFLSVAALLAAAPTAAQAFTPVPASTQNWSQRVEATAEGGYRMGNPDAPVKLVEYASITCSHCAAFSAAASQPLRERHIASGQVSWEIRPFLIFPSDAPIFRLMQCQAPAKFFDLSDQLFAAQAEWTGKLNQQGARLRALPPRALPAAIVQASGIDRLFREQGMTDAAITQCLSDQAALNHLESLTNRYSAQGVTGTPAFFINGLALAPASWAQLENMITLAAARN